ncbi:hypothetical protein ACQCVB_19675 [Fictibacillus phosphorivorans]|uniref:hypothetical protein n=1 Tax=Fictibacillus phosphorivorans TaxID=1221500 RepID=UPI003CED519E
MINKFSGFFSFLRGMGVIVITLYFFGVGKEMINEYLIWIFISLWIGVVGSYVIERLKKSKRFQ